MCKSCILSPDVLNRLSYEDNNEAVRDQETRDNEDYVNALAENTLSNLAEQSWLATALTVSKPTLD